MLAQLVIKLKRDESSRTELATSRVSSRATSILSSPTRRCSSPSLSISAIIPSTSALALPAPCRTFVPVSTPCSCPLPVIAFFPERECFSCPSSSSPSLFLGAHISLACVAWPALYAPRRLQPPVSPGADRRPWPPGPRPGARRPKKKRNSLAAQNRTLAANPPAPSASRHGAAASRVLDSWSCPSPKRTCSLLLAARPDASCSAARLHLLLSGCPRSAACSSAPARLPLLRPWHLDASSSLARPLPGHAPWPVPCAVAAAAQSSPSPSLRVTNQSPIRPPVKMKKRPRTLQSFFSPALTPVVCNVQPRSNLNSQPTVGTGTSNNQAQETYCRVQQPFW
jgi:hypothetical protein